MSHEARKTTGAPNPDKGRRSLRRYYEATDGQILLGKVARRQVHGPIGMELGELSLERRARRILDTKFHAWVLSKPATMNGASERQHKFDTALKLPDGRRVFIDVVKHQGNSINSAVVANLDVRRLEDPNILQRIVFDPDEKWKPEEIALLEVGAPPVALSGLAAATERIAA